MTERAERRDWDALVRLTGPHPVAPTEAVDWARVVRLAARHKTILLLRRGIERSAGTTMPEQARHALTTLSRQRAMRALRLARETSILAGVMKAAGIPCAIIKGEPLSRLIHGQEVLRDPGDIDLLVPADQVPRAADALTAQGLDSAFGSLLTSPRQRARLLRGTNQLEFYRSTAPLRVELHWRWQKVDGMMPMDAPRIWGAGESIMGGAALPVPDGVEHFIYLCTHGAAHGWTRLKWLNDIRWTLHNAQLVGQDWQAVADRARMLGMVPAVAASVALAARLNGQDVPAPLAALLRERRGAVDVSHDAEKRMLDTALLLADPPRPAAPLEIVRALLGHVETPLAGRPHAFATRLRLLTSPSPAELALIDLPRGLGGGYLVIRLLRALGGILRRAR